jgi:anti-sigma regulatory factor (Ser/Thr protein kinase)
MPSMHPSQSPFPDPGGEQPRGSGPFPEPEGEPLCLLRFTEPDLPRLRAEVAVAAEAAGLDPRRVPDFVLSAHELAANSVMHADGGGLLRLWIQGGNLVCEVSDQGELENLAAGRRRPDLSGEGGAGLWIVRQACDGVQIRSVPGQGTAVRMRMVLGARAEAEKKARDGRDRDYRDLG